MTCEGDIMPEKLRFLEKLELIIPGFKGYKEKEIRREQDKALRNRMVRDLESLKNTLIWIEEKHQGNIDVIRHIEVLIARLQKLEDKIEHADYGYAGFFDLIHIGEDELDLAYEHDLKIFDLIKKIEREKDLDFFKLRIEELEKEWDKREELFMIRLSKETPDQSSAIRIQPFAQKDIASIQSLAEKAQALFQSAAEKGHDVSEIKPFIDEADQLLEKSINSYQQAINALETLLRE